MLVDLLENFWFLLLFGIFFVEGRIGQLAEVLSVDLLHDEVEGTGRDELRDRGRVTRQILERRHPVDNRVLYRSAVCKRMLVDRVYLRPRAHLVA